MARYKGKGAIKRWEQNVRRRQVAAKRIVTTGVFEDIRDGTPVDTGVARADWRMKAWRPDNRPPLPQRPELRGKGTPIDHPPTPRLPRRLAVDAAIFITNPQEHIQYLENGTSEQAPFGMVGTALDSWIETWPSVIETLRIKFEGSENFDFAGDSL